MSAAFLANSSFVDAWVPAAVVTASLGCGDATGSSHLRDQLIMAIVTSIDFLHGVRVRG